MQHIVKSTIKITFSYSHKSIFDRSVIKYNTSNKKILLAEVLPSGLLFRL